MVTSDAYHEVIDRLAAWGTEDALRLRAAMQDARTDDERLTAYAAAVAALPSPSMDDAWPPRRGNESST